MMRALICSRHNRPRGHRNVCSDGHGGWLCRTDHECDGVRRTGLDNTGAEDLVQQAMDLSMRALTSLQHGGSTSSR